MAPTEILAQQHYFSARRILENAGYRIVLLTGSLESPTASEKSAGTSRKGMLSWSLGRTRC